MTCVAGSCSSCIWLVADRLNPLSFLLSDLFQRSLALQSTLIKCLVKHYTKYSLQSVNGPITVISSKKRRITFFECRNDLHSMCDLAKTADLVLLLVDASFGFEMETFEFLNILKTHGYGTLPPLRRNALRSAVHMRMIGALLQISPCSLLTLPPLVASRSRVLCPPSHLSSPSFPKVMGILTHLDHFKANKTLTKTKKKFKHRFWNEICDGAKLFYLSGLINGKYPKREILNLSRFISVTKFRPLLWRNTHAYVVADRYEDLTNPTLIEDNPKVDRRVVVYGYVRGTFLKPQQKVHVMGIGDFHMHSLQILDDPCPLKGSDAAAAAANVKRRSLNEKEKLLYAPMSDVGDVLYDADATYINLHDKHIHFSRRADIVADEDAEEAERERTGKPKPEWKPIYDKWGNVTNKPKAKFNPDTMLPSEDVTQLGEGQQFVRSMQDIRREATLDRQMEESGLQLFKGAKPILAKDFNDGADDGDEEEGERDGSDNDSDIEAEDAAEAERAGGRGELRTKDYRDEQTGRVRRKVLFDGETGEEEDDEGDEDGEGDEEDEAAGSDDEAAAAADDGDEGDDDDYYNDAPRRNASTTEGEEGEEDDEEEEEGEEEDDDAEMGEGEERGAQWKEDLAERAARNFGRKINLMELVYGDAVASNNRARLAKRKGEMKLAAGSGANADGSKKLVLFDSDSEDEDNSGMTNAERRSGRGGDDDDADDSFFSRAGALRDVTIDDLDSVKFNTLSLASASASASASARSAAPGSGSSLMSSLYPTRDWSTKDVFESIRNKFVTGDWSDDKMDEDGEDEDGDDAFGGKKRVQRDSDDEEEDKKAHRKERKNRRKMAAAAEGSKKASSGTMAEGEDEDDDDGSDDDADSEDEDAMNARLDRESSDILGQLTSGDISMSGSGPRKGETEEQAAARRLADKAALKNAFDSTYDLKRKRKSEGEDVTGENEPEPDFLGDWNSKAATQATINNEFAHDQQSASERLSYEGARSGTYVRIELLHVPCEFVTNFDPAYPLILGGLLNSEDNLGYMQIRLKKHRWHKKVGDNAVKCNALTCGRYGPCCQRARCVCACVGTVTDSVCSCCLFPNFVQILKTNDPLIFSIGWRRFQVMPVYSMEDKSSRARFLKYTPEHMRTCSAVTHRNAPMEDACVHDLSHVRCGPRHPQSLFAWSVDHSRPLRHPPLRSLLLFIRSTSDCIATIYGPITSQGTGVLAYANSTTKLANFRISATGVILELDHTFKIVKKLKLTGYPYKIYKVSGRAGGEQRRPCVCMCVRRTAAVVGGFELCPSGSL